MLRRAIMVFFSFSLLGATALAGWQIYRFVFRSDYFKFRQLTIVGASSDLDRDARKWFEDWLTRGVDNLCLMNPDFLTDQFGALPRARSVSVRKRYPSTLEVVFTERTPVVIVNLQGAHYLMDKDGVLLARIANSQIRNLDLPILSGLGKGSYSPGDRIENERLTDVLAAVAFLRQNERDIYNKIDEWHLGGKNEVTAIARLENRPELRFGNTPPLELLDKLVAVMQKDDAPSREMRKARKYIDLRVDGQLVYM